VRSKGPLGVWTWDASHGCWLCHGLECRIWLIPRPAYCDRGHWLAQVHAIGHLALDLDQQDGWPRYYFDLDRAKAEVEAWLQRRGQL